MTIQRRQRILCLDVGDARIGVAVSDEIHLMARPLEILTRKNTDVLAHIDALALREGAGTIVVGLPLNANGSRGRQARRVEVFASVLQAAQPRRIITLWDERYSSEEARELRAAMSRRADGRYRRVRRGGGPEDDLAAAVILQSYLDEMRRRADAAERAQVARVSDETAENQS